MDSTDTCTRIAEPNQIILPIKFPTLFGVNKLVEMPVNNEKSKVLNGVFVLNLCRMARHFNPSSVQFKGMSNKVITNPIGAERMS